MSTAFAIAGSVGPVAVMAFGPFTLPDGTNEYTLPLPYIAGATTTIILQRSFDGGVTWLPWVSCHGITVPLVAKNQTGLHVVESDGIVGCQVKGTMSALGTATFAATSLAVV